MFRYVALFWDDLNPTAAVRARELSERVQAMDSGWRRVFSHMGVEVLCRDARLGASGAHLLHQDSGVVLGTLFERGEGVSRRVGAGIGEAESAAIVASGGRRLVERYWGRYVAILHEPASRTTWVLRDPTGALPCFALRSEDIDVYVSHMEEGARLASGPFTINWTFVAGALCQSRLQARATGLNEVTQLLGGECLVRRPEGSSRAFYWNSLELSRSTPPIEDPAEAARLLRQVTRECVQAWASCFESIVHLLSGGLDSSIVLACLKDAPERPRITCLNFHSPGSNTDERTYARLAAEGMPCEIVERPRDSSLSLEPLSRIPRSCIPMDYFFFLDEGRAERQVAGEHGAGAVFSGVGGDQLFYQAQARLAAGDYVRSHGVGRGLFTVALDAARVDRMSVWAVLLGALRDGLLRRRWTQQAEMGSRRTLIREAVIHDIRCERSLVHPWFQAPPRVPNGKLWHAFQLLFPMDFYHPLAPDEGPEPVAPLFSQPLLELVMRIPTWLHALGGWDRALARRAFQRDVPRQIITRRAKGGQEEHAKALLARNGRFVRDLLLDGALVKERILDAERVRDLLSGRPTRTATSNAELFACVSVEAWLRQWRAV
ncbi:MAG: asparagine synthase [Steroidobacteraceae bacterium]|nr:asparagine synthase [Steroidobacteraceae bacterium]